MKKKLKYNIILKTACVKGKKYKQMLKKLKEKLNIIEKETGVNVYLFSDGEFVLGSDTLDFSFEDVKENKDSFTTFNVSSYLGVIKGGGNDKKIIANLIKELLSAFVLDGDNAEVLSILNGEANNEFIKEYIYKNGVKKCEVFAMLIEVEDKNIQESVEFFKNFASDEKDIVIKIKRSQIGYVKFLGKESKSVYRSCKEYAKYLSRSLFEETGIRTLVAVGEAVKDFKDIALSFAQAKETYKTVKEFSLLGDVYSYKDFLQIITLKDLGKDLIKKYNALLLTDSVRNVLYDEDLIKTVNALLGNALKQSETARQLYIHRNTLTYRLDKIYRETGLDVRTFDGAVAFRIISYLEKLS